MEAGRVGLKRMVLLNIIVLWTIGSRFWGLPAQGLSHFDAGEYALAATRLQFGRWDVSTSYYSPPLYPALIRASYFLTGGPVDWLSTAVSAAASVGVVWLGWSWSRRLFGSFAAVLLAWGFATSGLQILFARVGLTDALYCFFFLWTWERLDRGGLGPSTPTEPVQWHAIFQAGVLAGLAWWTKYSAPLLLVLPSIYILCSWRRWRLKLGAYSLFISIALCMYLPYAFWLHKQLLLLEPTGGGYWDLVQHHRGYARGLAGIPQHGGWLFSLWPQLVQSWWALGMMLGFVGCQLLQWKNREPTLPSGRQVENWKIGKSLLACLLLLLPPCQLPTLLGLAFRGVWVTQTPRATSLILILLLLAPATYSPYLRLWLPTHTFLLIFAVMGLVALSGLSNKPNSSKSFKAPKAEDTPILPEIRQADGYSRWEWLVLLLILSGCLWFWPLNFFLPNWQGLGTTHQGYRQAAAALQQFVQQASAAEASRPAWLRLPILVVARPPLWFYLGEPFVAVAPDTAFAVWPPQPVVLDDALLPDNPKLQEQLQQSKLQGWQLQRVWPTDPDLVTRYDDLPPEQIKDLKARQRYRLSLWTPP